MSNILKLIKKIIHKKVVLFGTGSTSKQLYTLLPITVHYCIDNDSQRYNMCFEGLKIVPPSVLMNENKNEIAIIIASQYHENISKQLINMGFVEGIHFWNGFQLLEEKWRETALSNQVSELKEILNQCMFEMKKQRELDDLRYRDLLELMQLEPRLVPNELINISCISNLAVDSNDHLYPLGTANDNTRWPAFVAKCEKIFGDNLAYLDLGCSGGGLVFDFALRGHFAMGLEGSDYSRRRLRAEWRTIPGNLFTCNISQPFTITVKKDQSVMQFDVISAWDVLEHLSVPELQSLLANVKRHLRNTGYFVGSISTQADGKYHVTVKDKSWWIDFFANNGFVDALPKTSFTFEDFPRGTGNLNSMTNFWTYPEAGFHFVLQAEDHV